MNGGGILQPDDQTLKRKNNDAQRKESSSSTSSLSSKKKVDSVDFQCDLTAPSGICLNGGEQILVPDATMKVYTIFHININVFLV